MKTFAEALDDFDARGCPWGPPTGLSQLDELTRGMVPGSLWMIIGGPGQGRTTLLLDLAARWAGHTDARVFLDCPREPSPRLVARLLANAGRLGVGAVWRGDDPTGQRVLATRAALSRSGLVLGGTAGVTSIDRLESLREHRPAAFLVDDADLVHGAGPAALQALTRDGAFVCVTLPRHLVALDDSEVPDLDPAWARAADLVLEVRTHNLTSRPGRDRAGEAEISILKNRHGPLYTSVVGFQGWYSRFHDLR